MCKLQSYYKNMGTENNFDRLKYIEQIKRLIRDNNGNYLDWSVTKEITNNFTVLPKLIDAILKDKAEENGEPFNMHRNLAQCIIDEEYKHLIPEEREPDCYADIEFEDALIITKCWGFDMVNSNIIEKEDPPLVCAIMNAYLNTFLSMD